MDNDRNAVTLDHRDLRAAMVLALLGTFISLLFAMVGALVSVAYLLLFSVAAAGLAVVAFNCLRGLKPA